MNIYISRFPFLFWFMINIQATIQSVESTCIINNVSYSYKPFNKLVFIIAKYTLPLIFVYFVFNRFDFVISKVRFVEIAIAILLLVFWIRTTKINKEILFIISILLIIVASVIFRDVSIAAFSTKYFLTLLLFKNMIDDYKKKVFCLFSDNKLIAHYVV